MEKKTQKKNMAHILIRENSQQEETKKNLFQLLFRIISLMLPIYNTYLECFSYRMWEPRKKAIEEMQYNIHFLTIRREKLLFIQLMCKKFLKIPRKFLQI